jgi:hypothetical protein
MKKIKINTGNREESVGICNLLNRFRSNLSFVLDGDYDYILGYNLVNGIGSQVISWIAEPHQVWPSLWENIDVLQRNKITFCWNKNFLHLENFVYNPYVFWHIWWMQDLLNEDLSVKLFDFRKEHFLCWLVGNKNFGPQDKYNLYLKRNEILSFLEGKNDFDLFGDWSHSNCKGVTKGQTADTLKKYKFAISLENNNRPTYSDGFVTERMYNALRCFTIPIYSGAANVRELVPPQCFIDYDRFKSFDDCYLYIKNMSVNEYDDYLHHISSFVTSDAFEALVSPKTMINTMCKIL